MALEPLDDSHAAQILAGTEGRLAGHRFEESLAEQINLIGARAVSVVALNGHQHSGSPAVAVLNYLGRRIGVSTIKAARAAWLGGLATGGGGQRSVPFFGGPVRRSKSDVVVEVTTSKGTSIEGISVKTCSKATPTNAQVYFTTAEAFCDRLEAASVRVSPAARRAMRMFCGDAGFRPADLGVTTSSTDRFFWEELDAEGRNSWSTLFSRHQADVTRLLLQTAYAEDPVPPALIVHQRFGSSSTLKVDIAVFSVDEFVSKSCEYGGFGTKPYRVLKGGSRDPNKWHEAPRFGVVQFQRGGQKQHPTQLQFNLKAGYFNEPPFCP